jgi:hypothetical protein
LGRSIASRPHLSTQFPEEPTDILFSREELDIILGRAADAVFGE